MTIEVEFPYWTTVYFITDTDNTPYIITGYDVRETVIMYICSSRGYETRAFARELSTEKSVSF